METQCRRNVNHRSESAVMGEGMVRILALLALCVLPPASPAIAAGAPMGFLLWHGQVRAAIVVGQGEFYPSVAGG
ncbi:MAG: hypothetical protein WB763_01460 [Terriglobia bacterium]|jgi:hypothetical protein